MEAQSQFLETRRIAALHRHLVLRTPALMKQMFKPIALSHYAVRPQLRNDRLASVFRHSGRSLCCFCISWEQHSTLANVRQSFHMQ